MLQDDIALVILHYYTNLNIDDVDRIISDKNYPTRVLNRKILNLAANLRKETEFSDVLEYTVNYSVNDILQQNKPDLLILDIIARHFNILLDDINSFINSVSVTLNESVQDRPYYGLLFAVKDSVSFYDYNVINYSDAIVFGDAYYLYHIKNKINKVVFISLYSRLNTNSMYVLLKLLKINVDLDILTKKSIINYFTGPIHYRRKYLDKKLLYNKIPLDTIRAIARAHRDYKNVLMPRFLYTSKTLKITPYLLDLETNIDEVIRQLEIVIPKFVQDKRHYILENSFAYETMLRTREQNKIQGMTDIELITKYGYVLYTSRNNLVDNIVNLHSNKGFFIPLFDKRCINSLTAYYENVNDDIVVAYGIVDQYYCYSATELTQQLSYNSISHTTTLNLWRSGDIITSIEKLVQLKQLVESYKQFSDFVKKLNGFLTKSVDISQLITKTFSLLTIPEKNQLKQLFIQLFNVGMFMRRWSGDGPYPMSLDESLILIDPEPKTIESLGVLSELLDNSTLRVNDFFLKLHIYKDRNHIDVLTIKETLNNILNGDPNNVSACIRTNAPKLIYTAYNYLLIMFLYTIPGFNIDNFVELA